MYYSQDQRAGPFWTNPHGVPHLNWLATKENQVRGSSQAGHVTALVLVGQPCHASLVRRDTRHFMTPLRAKFFIMTMMHLWDN